LCEPTGVVYSVHLLHCRPKANANCQNQLLDNPETEALNLEPGDQRSKPWDSMSNPESWQP